MVLRVGTNEKGSNHVSAGNRRCGEKGAPGGADVGDGCARPSKVAMGLGELLGFTRSAKVALSDEGQVICVFTVALWRLGGLGCQARVEGSK